MRATLLTALLCGSVALGGCNGDDTEPAERAGGGTETSTTGSGSPAAGSEQEPRNEPVDSPADAINRYWRWARIGSPTLATLYDRRLVRVVGSRALLAALAMQKSQFQLTPRIASTERTELGTLVTVRLRPPGGGGPVTVAYLLNRKDGDWVIQYDSVLTEGITSYVIQTAQRRIDRRARQPSPAAIAEGRAAADRVRSLFAPAPLQGRLTTRR